MHRRQFVGGAIAAGLAPWVTAVRTARQTATSAPIPTRFELACMTLPYAAFPFERALEGIKTAGFARVAWGVTHRDASGTERPALDVEAAPRAAASLAARCRDAGLEPVMMFSTVFLEEPSAAEAHKKRIAQAAAARIPSLLTFGRTRPGEYERVVSCLQAIGPVARQAGVQVLIKQHGGNTATGADCAKIIREVGDEGVRMCYDAGNVLDYERHDPIADIATCADDVRAFAIKDHRDWPRDEDCGPGFGEIDHYRLFRPVLHTARVMPLVFENIFEPLVPRPKEAAAIDALARRAREYVESVIRGLQSQA